MEKEIGKISKNPTTDIVLRIDDFGGKTGLTIREFVTGDRYVGFTKSGVRIPAEEFLKFKEMVNSIDEELLKSEAKTEDKTSQFPKNQETLNEFEEKIKIEKPGETEESNSKEASESEEFGENKEELPDY